MNNRPHHSSETPAYQTNAIIVGTGGAIRLPLAFQLRLLLSRLTIVKSWALPAMILTLLAAILVPVGYNLLVHLASTTTQPSPVAGAQSLQGSSTGASPGQPPVGGNGPLLDTSGAVQVWQTTKDYQDAITQKSSLNFSTGSASGTVVNVDDSKVYQQIEGFGASLTDSSATVLSGSSHKDEVMQKLFDSAQGIGISWLRQPIGASDFTGSSYYTYDDTPGDTNLSHFSIAHDQAAILPLLHQALQLNPAVKVIGTPWTPPAWMKTNNLPTNATGRRGTLNTTYATTYANYFVKYLQAYQAAGVPIYGITIQNEPGQTTDYPGMDWSGDNQATFVKNNLLPALRDAKLHPVLMTYDLGYASSFFTSYISAYQPLSSIINTAYHCYQGTNFPTLSASLGDNYQTECSTSISSIYSSKATQPLQPADLIMDVMRAGAKTATYWNAVEDQTNGPRYNNQGCGDQTSTNGSPCTPLVNINTATDAVTYNAEYYTLGHFSKFVHAGANRIDSSDVSGSGLKNVAFKNPDGSKVVVVHNLNASPNTFSVSWQGKNFSYTLPANALVTFAWSDAPAPLPAALQNLSHDWYFAEGSTAANYNTYFSLFNAGSQPANVSFSYLTQNSGVITKTHSIAPNVPTIIYANDDLPSGALFGAHLTSDQPILAERTEYFYNGGLGVPGASNVVGATAAQKQWYFAEGYTGTGFAEYLSIVNPTATAQTATVTYYYTDGTSKQLTVPLAPYQQVQRNVNTDVNAKRNVSAMVTADGDGVIAERLMYFKFSNANKSGSGPATIPGGDASLGANQLNTTFYFAEGYTGGNFNEYLTLFNPNDTASTAKLTYYVSGQSTPVIKIQALPAHSRQTVNVNNSLGTGKQFSVAVSSGVSIAAERLIYFAYANSNGRGATASSLITGGSVSSGVSTPGRLLLFAGGTTKHDYNEFLTVQNTNSVTANLSITYITSGGTRLTTTTTVPANTRSTVWVFRPGTGLGTQSDTNGVSAIVSSDQPIVAEKVMYAIGPNLNQSGSAPFNLPGGYATLPVMP